MVVLLKPTLIFGDFKQRVMAHVRTASFCLDLVDTLGSGFWKDKCGD